MSDLKVCASCTNTQQLKQCSRCKTVAYCSSACQRAHWQTHKPLCQFKVTLPSGSQATPSNDALSILRTVSDPGTRQKLRKASSVVHQTSNISELRLSVFSLLSARDLLRVQRACRSWYMTIATEKKLQQRMFFTAGPGELIMPARKGSPSIIRFRDRPTKLLLTPPQVAKPLRHSTRTTLANAKLSPWSRT